MSFENRQVPKSGGCLFKSGCTPPAVAGLAAQRLSPAVHRNRAAASGVAADRPGLAKTSAPRTTVARGGLWSQASIWGGSPRICRRTVATQLRLGTLLRVPCQFDKKPGKG